MSTSRSDADAARRQRLFALLGGAALLAAVLVVVLIVVSQGGDDTEDRAEPVAALEDVPEDGIVLGDPEAPVTMVEFADPQCPFCAEFATAVLPELVDEYVASGEVRMELRLVNFIGDDSRRLANAAHAAGEQDGMWRFMDLAFARQGAENSGYAELAFIEKLAVDAGLRPEPILTAANFPEPDEPSEEARRLAGEAGVNSTPSFLIGPSDGELEALEFDSLDADSFRGPIDDAVAAAGGGDTAVAPSSPGY